MVDHRRDGVVVRASASQSVDLGFIPLVESYQKTLKNGIHSFPAWRSAHKGSTIKRHKAGVYDKNLNSKKGFCKKQPGYKTKIRFEMILDLGIK